MKKVNSKHIRSRLKITESSMTTQTHCQCSYFVSFIVLSQVLVLYKFLTYVI